MTSKIYRDKGGVLVPFVAQHEYDWPMSCCGAHVSQTRIPKYVKSALRGIRLIPGVVPVKESDTAMGTVVETKNGPITVVTRHVW